MEDHSQFDYYPIIAKDEYDESRNKKASILDYHSIFLSHGQHPENSLEIISRMKIFQDHVSQEFIETLFIIHETPDLRKELNSFSAKYSLFVTEDIEIYHLVRDNPVKVAEYLRKKNAYSKPKQLLAKIYFLSHKGYRAEEIFAIINSTEDNPKIIEALNTREDNGQLSTTMFINVLPQHISIILESMLLNSISLSTLDKVLELDF